MNTPLDIAPATGRLGVLTPGMGAVASTFIAGVIAARNGLTAPIGSVSQMAHIRLGNRDEDRNPLIREFVPLADLDDLDFYLELSEADWRELVENTKANGGADRRHTLNTLDLTANDGLAQNAMGDQLRGDIFFRVNESLQYFFDQAAKLETVFE